MTTNSHKDHLSVILSSTFYKTIVAALETSVCSLVIVPTVQCNKVCIHYSGELNIASYFMEVSSGYCILESHIAVCVMNHGF